MKIKLCVWAVMMSSASMATESIRTLEDLRDQDCRVDIRYSGTRTGKCYFDDVVTGVQMVSSGVIQVECGRVEVTCPAATVKSESGN